MKRLTPSRWNARRASRALTSLWDHDNNGLKRMKVRFCETTCGEFTTVP